MFKTVTARLHTMRKPQEFVVMSMSNGHIMVQSEKSIGQYDPATGKGVLSVKGSTFVHLSFNGFRYEFPGDFRHQVTEALSANGPESDLGGVIVKNNEYIETPRVTRGESSQTCLDAGVVCSILSGACTECGAPEKVD